eukprot:SAG11_NODE_63_length_18904_cov_11.842914_12_plen_106_part_00
MVIFIFFIIKYFTSRLELTNQQGIYHRIDDEQGFPKPVEKVPELFGRGFYGRWKIEEIGSRPVVGTGTTKYRLYTRCCYKYVHIPLISPGNLREIKKKQSIFKWP